MEDVFVKIINHDKFYSLLPQHKNSFISEKITQVNHSCLHILCFLKINNENMNSFLKFLTKMTILNNFMIQISITFDMMENSFRYVIVPNDKNNAFRASGKILFDNEKNILIHESSVESKSKIMKFKKFKNSISQKMENEILQVFQIYDNYT